MNSRLLGAAATIVAAVIPAAAQASDSVTQPIPAFVTTLDYPDNIFGSSAFTPIDLGQSFNTIDTITIDLAGVAQQGEADFGVGDIGPFWPDLVVGIDGVEVGTGAFIGANTAQATFSSSSVDLSSMLDGTATLSLRLDDVFANDFFLSTTLTLSTASITVDGTFVPEPTTPILAAAAALLVLRRARRTSPA